MSLLIPEIIIQDAVNSILASIVANWDLNVDKTNTALYRMLNGNVHGNYDYYEQAQSVFLKNDSNQRKIQVKSSYPTDKSEFPCIVINNSSRSTEGVNSIGFGEGVGSPIFDDINQTYATNTSRSFGSTYSILILSDNKNEVNLIYYVLEAFLVVKEIFEHLTLCGLENLKISGREMLRLPDEIPVNAFVKSLQLTFFSTQVVDQLTANSMLQNLKFGGLASENFNLNGGVISGVQNLVYVGGLGVNNIGFQYDDNSDNSGLSNESDIIIFEVFNLNKGEWFYSGVYSESNRSSALSQWTLSNAWSDGDQITINAKFLRGDRESETTVLKVNFVE